jgi:hypothetical protein
MVVAIHFTNALPSKVSHSAMLVTAVTIGFGLFFVPLFDVCSRFIEAAFLSTFASGVLGLSVPLLRRSGAPSSGRSEEYDVNSTFLCLTMEKVEPNFAAFEPPTARLDVLPAKVSHEGAIDKLGDSDMERVYKLALCGSRSPFHSVTSATNLSMKSAFNSTSRPPSETSSQMLFSISTATKGCRVFSQFPVKLSTPLFPGGIGVGGGCPLESGKSMVEQLPDGHGDDDGGSVIGPFLLGEFSGVEPFDPLCPGVMVLSKRSPTPTRLTY